MSKRKTRFAACGISFLAVAAVFQLVVDLEMRQLMLEQLAAIRPGGTAAAAAASAHLVPIDRIYYINLAKNTKRNALMQKWLDSTTINPYYPYTRVEAVVGLDNECPAGVTPERCRGMAGLAKTNLGILRRNRTEESAAGTKVEFGGNSDFAGNNHNSFSPEEKFTLVFEDDYYVTQPLHKALEKTLRHVPDDWDIIRWDCKGPIRSSFPVVYREEDDSFVVFRAAHLNECLNPEAEQNCLFCGSTHAMLWRHPGSDAVQKLERLWSRQPYDDIDCRLVVSPDVVGYCVNMNLGRNEPPSDEWSDITWIGQGDEQKR